MTIAKTEFGNKSGNQPIRCCGNVLELQTCGATCLRAVVSLCNCGVRAIYKFDELGGISCVCSAQIDITWGSRPWGSKAPFASTGRRASKPASPARPGPRTSADNRTFPVLVPQPICFEVISSSQTYPTATPLPQPPPQT